MAAEPQVSISSRMGLSLGSSFICALRASSCSLCAGLVKPPSMVAMARCQALRHGYGLRVLQDCNTSLPVLGANLCWTYHPVNGTADVAFRAPQSAGGWVAWDYGR
ncbi:cytochrome b561 and DOMON domain-containing protein [Panicum miliaceum]|uniref:Cytochrome b561 and DOMON domain-containing protein n=1 Tax=Panicum miliaceum TaxID=4540 RepID=A0A3L6TG95_PANMI|nr:cytochrome b561 and DOMON domain-containing protein [Panicum miliaceum]